MGTTLERETWQALGTSVELILSHTGPRPKSSSRLARAVVERQLAEIDRACSRFRVDSELTRVNLGAGRATRVSPLLIEAIEVALRAAQLTDGDVDPTVGAALVLAGYDRDWCLLASIPAGACDRGGSERALHAKSRLRASLRAGWEAVELDAKRAMLRIPAGIKLDLGASAKAWAADRAAKAAYETTGQGVLLSLGGDISTAGSAPAGGWRIHVTDDHRSAPDAPGQTISIVGGGLATSSTTVRRWRQEGRAMHHIIDPSSGAPAQEVWRTVSVAAADCADANIAATAAIVRGERAPQWLAELGLPARLVRHNGHVLLVGAWPQGLQQEQGQQQGLGLQQEQEQEQEQEQKQQQDQELEAA
jgi:thiamine biosynthesis lipoprotein ApbE